MNLKIKFNAHLKEKDHHKSRWQLEIHRQGSHRQEELLRKKFS